MDSDELKELLNDARDVWQRGLSEVERQARLGKLKLESVKLQNDQRLLFERLGKELFFLMEERQIAQIPQLEKPYQLLKELEVKLEQLSTAMQALEKR